MPHIYLEHHDPDKNRHRFYQLFVTPGLFGDWSLVREWGGVGSPGQVRRDWFDNEPEALEAAGKVSMLRRKKAIG
jgi:predicted DNA-binding WGR domain protein